MGNNKIVVQSLWHGNKLSDMEKLCISSFLYHGHEFHLYVYDELEVPDGVLLKDANNIINIDEIFQDSQLKGSFANFSDIFRYKMLYDNGGFWVDTDLVCLRQFDFPQDYIFCSEFTQKDTNEFSRFGYKIVNGAVTKVPKGSEIMKYCYEKSMELRSGEYEWWELGPPMLNDAVIKFELSSYIKSPNTFMPVDWWSWRDLISSKLSTRIKLKLKLLHDVYAIHLWNSMWSRKKLDRNKKYNSYCLYEKLKNKYLK